MSFGATNPDGMLQSYSEYLRKVHPENANRFDQLRISDREAAIAEAVVFGILQGFKVNPQIHDQPNSGGPDFICSAYRGPLAPPQLEDGFVVEATSLDPDAVTERSHIANEVPEDVSGGAFGLVTRNICNKAKAKATQLANYPMPRVLAIASSHAASPRFFNNATAMWALTSEPHWRHEIGSDTVDTAEYTDLESSCSSNPAQTAPSFHAGRASRLFFSLPCTAARARSGASFTLRRRNRSTTPFYLTCRSCGLRNGPSATGRSLPNG